MYPPKATDAQVHSLIRELSANGKLPSGSAVRRALAQRYGSRGGVARIYRLLSGGRAGEAAAEVPTVVSRLLEFENRTLRDQMQQGRQRENSHQAYWEREVEQLRERVRALEASVQSVAIPGALSEALLREVNGAETRAGQLEVALRAFGPAAGRADSGE